MNVTSIFKQAYDNRIIWNLDCVAALLEQLRLHICNSTIDWERGNEEWGRILDQNRVVAIVCCRCPLLIAVSEVKRISHSLIDANIMHIDVMSMSEKTLVMEKSVLEAIFEKELSNNIDYGHLSVDDLWWCTV